ncbi:MAG: DegT/DnrJ/EryC1/StrS family aminotransferase, partial [bacterium]
IAKERGLFIIQDCAHAIESEWHGKNLAAYGDLSCYSFYATKNVTTGEGGMVTTARDDWADRIRMLALHGLDKGAYNRYSEGGSPLYDLIEPGYKFNMPDTAAALGIEGLALAEKRLLRRTEIWQKYTSGLGDLPGLTLPAPEASGTRHARHLFTCVIDSETAGINRDRILECLASENIGTGLHYRPVHRFSYYKNKYGFTDVDFPHASRIGDGIFSLPLTAYLTDDEVGDVIRAVTRIILHYSRLS